MDHQPQEKRKRAPKRCLKCPHKPLLSTCAEHRFRKRKAADIPPEPPQDDRQERPPVSPSSAQPLLPDAAGLPPQNITPVAVAQPPPDPPIDPQLLAEDLLRQQQQQQQRSLTPPPSSPSPSTTFGDTTLATPPPSSPSPSTIFEESLDPEGSSSEDNDSDTEAGQKRKRKGQQYRRQPSGRNATWGVVEGAGRGSEPYPIHRVRELKPVIKNRRKATKDLDRWTTDLLTRCESISDRSGCWLYMAIQHPTSKTPFIHFTSRRLRKDAPQHVQAIHNEVRQTMNALTRADRRARVEVESELEKTKEQLENANKRADHLESRLEALLEKLSRHENLGGLGVQAQIVATQEA